MASFVQVVDQLLICCLSPDKCYKVHQLSTTDALCSSRQRSFLFTKVQIILQPSGRSAISTSDFRKTRSSFLAPEQWPIDQCIALCSHRNSSRTRLQLARPPYSPSTFVDIQHPPTPPITQSVLTVVSVVQVGISTLQVCFLSSHLPGINDGCIERCKLQCSACYLQYIASGSSQAAWQCQHCVNGDRMEIGKWQNLTPHRFKTLKPIGQKLSWVIRSTRRPAVSNLAEIGSRGSSGEMGVFLNYRSFFTLYIYTVNHKKRGTLFFTITMTFLGQFLHFLQQMKQE